MDLKEIRQLIKMLDGTDVTELVLRQEGQTLRISRGVVGGTAPAVVLTAPPVAATAPLAPVPVTSPTAQVAAVQAAAPREEAFPNAVPVTSPMVGTFYRSSSPEALPFVGEGDVVKKGQVLCIIEAMKLMNEIEAEMGGRVVKVLKDNASPVEYGDELFLIEPV